MTKTLDTRTFTVEAPLSRDCRDLQLRYMRPRDVAAVLDIEAQQFAWPIRLCDMQAIIRDRGIGLLAELYGRIVGHALFEIDRREVWLHSIAVEGAFQRHGIGGALMTALKQMCRQYRYTCINCEVGEKNLAAHIWLSRRGFVADAVSRQPWISQGCTEDGYSFLWRSTWE